MNQDWHLRWVRIPDGTHLSGSKDTPGVERDLLREDGTNKLLGPTESFPADEDALLGVHAYETDSPRSADVRELSPAQQALADAIAEVLETVVREVVSPVVKEVVAPAIKRKLSGIAKSLRSTTREASGQAGTAELAVLAATPPADSFREVDAAVEGPRTSMSSAEFQQRLIAALAAEEYATEQKRMLINVRIEDDNLPPKLRGAIKLALEGNASLLDEGTLAVVVKFLRGAPIADGEYVLTRNKEIKEAS
ncbi:hypothetical protein ACFOY2_42225 [Nonomuraea purpurea]|uniref:Uncharacterized protein n=1 Tax=Nonomuraea purpurea TaxID=1849276 RepID=A0ABV8GLL2_9ACTN